MRVAERNITLSHKSEQDEAFFQKLFHQQHADEFAALQLPEAAVDQLLTMQYRGRMLSYRAAYPAANDRVISVNGQPAGRLTTCRTDDADYLIDILLTPELRGHGIGTSLIRDLLADAAARGVPLRLQVRVSNPAIRLYERLGFAVYEGDDVNKSMEWTPIPSAGHSAVAQPADGFPAQPETSAYFRTWLGQALLATSVSGESAWLTLEDVAPLLCPELKAVRGDSFVLSFSGPPSPAFHAETLAIDMGDRNPLQIFLSPVALHDDIMKYEAIFNRLA